MLNYAEQRARALRDAGDSPPTEPIDVDALAAALGCCVEEVDRLPEGGIEASLLPHVECDRFTIRVDPTPRAGWGPTPPEAVRAIRRHRRRFRIAHELAHLFSYARRAGTGPVRLHPTTPWEETLCDETARALLVPPAALAPLRPSATTPFLIATRFDVSLELAARALLLSSSSDRGGPVVLACRRERCRRPARAPVVERERGAVATSLACQLACRARPQRRHGPGLVAFSPRRIDSDEIPGRLPR